MPSLTFKLNGIETNSYWTQAGENKAPALLRMGWIADYPSIDNFIYLFTTEGGKYGSYSWYSNAEVDKLFKEARSTTDEAQRFNLYNEAQKLILADAPASRSTRTATLARATTAWVASRTTRSVWSTCGRCGSSRPADRLPACGRLSKLHPVIQARRSAAVAADRLAV